MPWEINHFSEEEFDMLLELIHGLGIFYLYTWFIWPFVFMFTFIYSINDLIKSKKPTIKIIIASISLLLIICGIMAILMSIK